MSRLFFRLGAIFTILWSTTMGTWPQPLASAATSLGAARVGSASSAKPIQPAQPAALALGTSAPISLTAVGIEPILITVTVGTTVEWRNLTDQDQTLVSGVPQQTVYLPLIRRSGAAAGGSATQAVAEAAVTTADLVTQSAPLFSALLAPGAAFTYTFNTLGAFPYYLANARNQRGQVVVEGAPLAPGGIPNFGSSTAFLYTGAQPIQTGVTPGAISAPYAAVLRGHVFTREGAPLPGVQITALDHPEYGQTLSRADGQIDLAINGGGWITLSYSKAGYLPAQRQVQVPWQDFAQLPDVVLIPQDTQVTAINLNAAAPVQVAQASLVSDTRGQRRATLFFMQGTRARLAFKDGSSQAISTLSVRATEYTVGNAGPQAMPGELPAASGYTYAVDFGVDEALALGALEVVFDKPVYFYLENFLNFPVGTAVPVGYYDRLRSAWTPADNGQVIKVLSITGGLASLDTNGDSLADGAAALAALNLTPAEQQQLASLYLAGQTLWRVPIAHFSPWDCNWPYGPPDDATPPQQPAPYLPPQVNQPDSSNRWGVIEAQNQVFREAAALAGTPFSLNYASNRMKDYVSPQQLNIPLSSADIPASLKRIEVEVDVAGQHHTYTAAAAPNQSYIFTWDGLDAYGRTVPGTQPAVVRIGYVYDAVYQQPADLARAFGRLSGVPMAAFQARSEVTLWQMHPLSFTPASQWFASAQGIGGWTLNIHHAYDPGGKILYYGNGTERRTEGKESVLDTVTGSTHGFGGDGGPAKDALLSHIDGLARAPDGSLYLSDGGNGRLRRIGPDGIMTTIAGNGTNQDTGDGGPATEATLGHVTDLALGPDGSLYIAETCLGNGEFCGVRKIAPTGIITTVAGGVWKTGVASDGVPATQAEINPVNLAVGPDSSLYILESDRLRQVLPDGRITTLAGAAGVNAYTGDGGPATQARLYSPEGLALDGRGNLYFSDFDPVAGQYAYGRRIRRISANGLMTHVAGSGVYGDGGDGGPALDAQLRGTAQLAIGPDDSLYIYIDSLLIRRLLPDGRIIRVMGAPATGNGSANGQPALQADFSGYGCGGRYPVNVAPTGDIYFVDCYGATLHVVRTVLPGFSGANDIVLPSEDGQLLYQFDAHGRHLATLNALTQAPVYTFGYDALGRLSQVTDRDGKVTQIERNAEGAPLAVQGPFGQRTSLTLDAQGYLAGVTNPAGETVHYTYTSGGLLTAMTNPQSQTYHFDYDDQGRLIEARDPAGGATALAVSQGVSTTLINVITAQTAGVSLTTQYGVESLSNGDQRRTTLLPETTAAQTLVSRAGNQVVHFPDGAVDTISQGPDPRFGMAAPMVTAHTYTTPGGLQWSASATRQVQLAMPGDSYNLASLTNAVTINGREFTSVYSAANRVYTTTSAAGRQAWFTLDAQGRLVAQQVAGLSATTVYSYNPLGQLAAIIASDGRQTRTWSYTYDSRGYVVSAANPVGQIITFTRDAAGRFTAEALPGGRTAQISYDVLGNVASVTPPGQTAHSFSYTPVDKWSTYQPPAASPGGDTGYVYNLNRQIARIAQPGGVNVDYVYDSAARLSTLAYPGATVNFSYTPAGYPAAITRSVTNVVNYAYDAGLLTELAWNGDTSGTVTRVYNNDLHLSALRLNGNALAGFNYDDDGLLTSVAIGANSYDLARHAQNSLITHAHLAALQTDFAYTPFGELKAYTTTTNGGAVVYRLDYDRDLLGRILTRTETTADGTQLFGYHYDAVGRLAQVTQNGTPTEAYAYDANGNRTSATTPSGTVSGSYDAQDRLLQRGNLIYSYTANGELSTKSAPGGVTSYTYDALGNLLAVALPDGKQVAYTVDGTGRRIARSYSGTVQRFIYLDASRPAAQLDENNEVTARFIYGSRAFVPDVMEKGGTLYRLLTDRLGSVRLVVDADTGAVAQQLEYDAFGQVLTDTAPGFQPFGFAGGLYDPATGLTRFGLRDYDAEAGRWTAKDPIRFASSDFNLYAYSLNDPVNYYDPLGLDALQTANNASLMGTTTSVFADAWSKGLTNIALNADDYANLLNAADKLDGFNAGLTIAGTVISGVQLASTVNNYKQGKATGLDIIHDTGSAANSLLGFVPVYGTIASAAITGIDLGSQAVFKDYFNHEYGLVPAETAYSSASDSAMSTAIQPFAK